MDATTLTVLIVVLFPLVFAVFWCAVLFLLSRLGGWSRLARQYARNDVPDSGREYRWQSGRVGLVGYNHCLHVRVRQSGLALSVAFPLSVAHPPLFIPWSAIHDREDVSMFWLKATRFEVGQPTLARLMLPRKVFDEAPAQH